MITDIRQQGFEDGYKAGKEARSSGMTAKSVIDKLVVDDKELAKKYMQDLKHYNVRWDTCFRLAIKYSFGYDNGVAQAAYESD